MTFDDSRLRPVSTGDAASNDAEGFMTIRDRAKDIIKSGGEWISSVELKSIALNHAAIADAAAIAARRERWGERPILVAVKKSGAELAENEMLAFFSGEVAKRQSPDGAIFVATSPRNAAGKLMKTKRRGEYGNIVRPVERSRFEQAETATGSHRKSRR